MSDKHTEHKSNIKIGESELKSLSAEVVEQEVPENRHQKLNV